ncbi:hypothetical protein [Heyndrickxia camelliae]|uniref:Uncharacterized protein n=1 Tax=Heyndrickxia camelliae TaxID=1707093 RepID=A0A2N3LK66_9BACI|nr:hypothetical protein [Heyndrickxia camelliae]PKR84939.1 hypothetical protein CWO92_11260 [Heyndrickxia camelliae]
MKIKTYSDIIAEDLQQEKKLIGEYFSLLGNAVIEFNGEKMSFFQLNRYTISKDRSERKQAYEAISSYYSNHEDKLDDIFD